MAGEAALVTTAPRRRGPVPRFSREQLVDAALAVVEANGFGALSLRSVARHIGVGPMTLYTYVDSSDELAALVVDRLVEDTVSGLRWPRPWREVLRLFAKRLDALVKTHPAMVEAYQGGMIRSGRADQVASDVIDRVMADGLTREQARDAYVAVQAFVLGFALIRAAAHADPTTTEKGAGSSRALRNSDPSQKQMVRFVDKVLDGFAP